MMHLNKADGTGFDAVDVSGLPANDLGNPLAQFGTDSGTLPDKTGTFDPDLQSVIDAWPALPNHAREAILAIVRGVPVTTDR